MPTQAQSGKAFEYALINEANNILSESCGTNVIIDAAYNTALRCFELFNVAQQDKYTRAAIAAIRHIITLEPRLNNALNNDVLTLQLMPDNVGQEGDVRDILLIRVEQGWQIGISAKNNHAAVKHSRLSDINDFGASWLGVNCSQNYFDKVIPIFHKLRELKGTFWRDVVNKHRNYYMPVLTAFRDELMRINQSNPDIPQIFASYLIGNNDFYKTIKRRNVTEIWGFNLNGTLNKSFGKIRPASRVHRLRLPTEIIQFQMKPNSTDTLLMVCNEGWTISFRIHNAESLVVPSLKFDVTLIGQPPTMYSHQEQWI